jgi:hypothetical protein
MGKVLKLAMWAGVGAALMYWLDPAAGRQRRALVRDKLAGGTHQTAEALKAQAKRAADRAKGLMHGRPSEPQDDEQMRERIRARLGHLTRHAAAIEVEVQGSRVCLRGPILASDVEPVVFEVRHMPGVELVDNQLNIHEQPGNIPGLQGNGPLPGSGMGRPT